MPVVLLCPGQGAQSVGMGKSWFDASPIARGVFEQADAALAGELPGGAPLSELAFGGPPETLHRTDVSQPALYAVGVASANALAERGGGDWSLIAAAGLSLGEYTALHLAGAFSFEDGLRLVALRGRLMQEAAEASKGSMVALIGGDESQAQAVCDAAAGGEVLVCANFNAPGQIVLSGHAAACQRALEAASQLGLRATGLQVAGAFHSPLMAPAAEGLAKALSAVQFEPLRADVWSNVTARSHDRSGTADEGSRIKKLLVEQLVSPVRWSQSCTDLIATLRAQTAGAASGGEPSTAGTDGTSAPAGDAPRFQQFPTMMEVAPGSVLKGLMRRIDRTCEVITNDQAS